MTEITKETITTQTPVARQTTLQQTGDSEAREVSSSRTIEYVVYFFLGMIEILLAFRFMLKLTGASTASAFVRGIYSVTNIFIMPFEGIFRRAVNQGAETSSIFEPSTLVAMLVYAVIAWGIVKMVRILSGEHQPE
jgi:YGGT family